MPDFDINLDNIVLTVNGQSPDGTGDVTVSTSNIYNYNGTLTANRTLTGDNKTLTLDGTKQFRVISADPGAGQPSISFQGYGTSGSDVNMRVSNGAGNTIFENYGDRTTRYYGSLALGDAPVADQMFRSYTTNGAIITGVFQNDGSNGTAFVARTTASGGRGAFFTSSGSNSTGVQGSGTLVGIDGITSDSNSYSTRGLFSSDSSVGGVAVVGISVNASDSLRNDLNHTGMFSGIVLHYGYSKSALPSLANKPLHYGEILVIDAGAGDDEYTKCIFDGTNWIDIRTQLPVV